eukprot:COSAG02_NODE_3547_length_6582_cov_6.857319_3_plen_334_part_00
MEGQDAAATVLQSRFRGNQVRRMRSLFRRLCRVPDDWPSLSSLRASTAKATAMAETLGLLAPFLSEASLKALAECSHDHPGLEVLMQSDAYSLRALVAPDHCSCAALVLVVPDATAMKELAEKTVAAAVKLSGRLRYDVRRMLEKRVYPHITNPLTSLREVGYVGAEADAYCRLFVMYETVLWLQVWMHAHGEFSCEYGVHCTSTAPGRPGTPIDLDSFGSAHFDQPDQMEKVMKVFKLGVNLQAADGAQAQVSVEALLKLCVGFRSKYRLCCGRCGGGMGKSLTDVAARADLMTIFLQPHSGLSTYLQKLDDRGNVHANLQHLEQKADQLET